MDASDHPPTLIVLFGPPAVGKMTVGQALERLTAIRLFHAHQVIDLLTAYFPFGSPSYDRLHRYFKRRLMEEAVESGLDLIITTGWRFDVPADREAIWSWVEPYVVSFGRVYFVELTVPLATRLERNRTENRLRHKRTDWATEAELRRQATTHRQHSDGTIPFDLPFLRIETEQLSAEATAERICAHFGLPHIVGGS